MKTVLSRSPYAYPINDREEVVDTALPSTDTGGAAIILHGKVLRADFFDALAILFAWVRAFYIRTPLRIEKFPYARATESLAESTLA